MSPCKVLVTGARGFVGEALVFHLLLDRRFAPVAAVRGPTRLQGLCPLVQLELGSSSAAQLAGIDVVVHAAARVHVMRETADDALAEFRHLEETDVLGDR